MVGPISNIFVEGDNFPEVKQGFFCFPEKQLFKMIMLLKQLFLLDT